eukprot:GGOE01017956.1.p1 GENE.GGOE01017956.1~~GGOE01017956.1.p1  ORF type:complete len:713 (-),score=137.56 GGOE01017956.1:79-2217(-)
MWRPLQAIAMTIAVCLLSAPLLFPFTKDLSRPSAKPRVEAHEGAVARPASAATASPKRGSALASRRATREIRNGVLWVTGAVTQGNSTVIPTPSSDLARAFWHRNREPDNATTKSLGRLPSAVVACEYFSVSFAMWLLDCLPRLTSAAAFIRSSALPFLLPGEPFALQYAVEVLHLPETQSYVLPAHLLWGGAHPMYSLAVDTLHFVPRLTTKDQQKAALSELRTQLGIFLPSEVASTPEPLQVLFSQRLDMTMPYNHTVLLQTMCGALSTAASCSTVRFETLSVVAQIHLARQTNVLMGPPGANLLQLLHLREGSLVVELQPSRTLGAPRYSIGASPLQYSMYAGVYDAEVSQAEELCQWFGLQYRRHLPLRDVAAKSQPVVDPASLARTVAEWVSAFWRPTTTAPSHVPSFPKQGTVAVLSPMLLECQQLFHQKRTYRLLGTFKDTYFVPSMGFALKVANSAANRKRAGSKGFVGDWRTLQREMVVLRNLSEPHITPALALCFDAPFPKYAQERFAMQLGFAGQTKAVRIANVSHFHTALAGYLQLWRSHERRGSFLFYCDAGPKNWAISRDGTTLQMFDFDNTYSLLPGTLCSDDLDCGCYDASPSSCVDHRCTYDGMAQKLGSSTSDWIRQFVLSMLPTALRSNAAALQLVALVKQRVKCEEVYNYLQQNAPSTIAGQPYPCRSGLDMDPPGVREAREELARSARRNN